jgi:hypothetical protein
MLEHLELSVQLNYYEAKHNCTLYSTGPWFIFVI